MWSIIPYRLEICWGSLLQTRFDFEQFWKEFQSPSLSWLFKFLEKIHFWGSEGPLNSSSILSEGLLTWKNEGRLTWSEDLRLSSIDDDWSD